MNIYFSQLTCYIGSAASQTTTPNDVCECSASISSEDIQSSTATSSTSALLKNYLDSIEVDSEGENENDDEDLKQALIEIDNFNPKPIDIKYDVMEYCKEKKFKFPHLYQLAMVVHSVPPTQVSVERSFSALKLILTDLRSNLSSDSLKKLLFVKLNDCWFTER